jgi:glycosyltransferase involved in cell wall biosynthesis
MRIAIDCRLWNFKGASTYFLGSAILPHLLQASSAHQYFLVFDQAPPANLRVMKEITLLVLKPKANSAATRALWYDLRLPAILSGHKIDLFVGAAGYISLRSPVKQVLLLHDALSGERASAATGWPGSWFRRRLPAMIEKASLVITGTRAQINEILPVAKPKQTAVIPACNSFSIETLPNEAARAETLDKFTNGIAYLLCREGWETLDDGIELLMAFSAFKKRQQTGMKLLLLGTPPPEKVWAEKLNTFRYREDVVVMCAPDSNEELSKLLCSAYALIHLPAAAKLIYLQAAFHCGVPVITWPLPSIMELAGDAALYCTDAPGETVAQNMMRIYKDENMRAGLIKKGMEYASLWKPQIVAQQLLEACTAII